jgi:hypothetical protein
MDKHAVMFVVIVAIALIMLYKNRNKPMSE